MYIWSYAKSKLFKLVTSIVLFGFLFQSSSFAYYEEVSTLRPGSTANTNIVAANLRENLYIRTAPTGIDVQGLLEGFVEQGKSADELNAQRLEAIIDSGQLQTAQFRWLEDELPSIDIPAAIESLRRGELAIYLFAAGEASRLRSSLIKYGVITESEENDPESLRRYRMWNLDLWDVADRIRQSLYAKQEKVKELGEKTSRSSREEAEYKRLTSEIAEIESIIPGLPAANPAYAKSISLGLRHLYALTEGIRQDAERYNVNPDEILKNLKYVICVNSDILEDVERDLKANNFFGLNPENIVLVMNDLAPGFVQLPDGTMVEAPDKRTNYNHGFNIINSNQPNSSYVYNAREGRFELQRGKTAFAYLRERGARTAVIHRMNDLILMHPQSQLDIGTYGLYQREHAENGANGMIEVLNNFTGQKGGLLLGSDQLEPTFGFLAEGLATKTDEVQAALEDLRRAYKQQGLPDIPYNRMYQYFDIEQTQANLDANNGIMPMSVKDNKPEPGIWSPEIPTGDITILPGSKTAAVMRHNDLLIDGGILPQDEHYTPGQGTLIHDFKELKNLTSALAVLDYQDRVIRTAPTVLLRALSEHLAQQIEAGFVNKRLLPNISYREKGRFFVQVNPERDPAKRAKTKSGTGCFLCPVNMPVEEKPFPYNDNFTIYANPSPIDKGHIVFASNAHIEGDADQYVTEVSQLEEAIGLFEQLGGFTVFFNGKGAAASSDHFHFQALNLEKIGKPLPVETAEISVLAQGKGVAIGVTKGYPALSVVFESGDTTSLAEQVFGFVNVLNTKKVPYNIVISSPSKGITRIYVFPRAVEKPSDAESNLLAIRFGSLEMAGLFIVYSDDIADGIQEQQLDQSLKVASLGKNEFSSIIGAYLEPIYRNKLGLFGLNQTAIDKIVEDVKTGRIVLSLESLKVIDVQGDELGAMDRQIVHKTGLLHQTANAFILMPDGRVVLQRRPPTKSEPLNFSIYGGHVAAGDTYETTIERELAEELGINNQLSGRLYRIGEEGAFNNPIFGKVDVKGKPNTNNEQRSLYVYVLSEDEAGLIEQRKRDLDTVKQNKTTEEFNAYIQSLRDKGDISWEIYGIEFFDINALSEAESKPKPIEGQPETEWPSNRYIQFREPFTDATPEEAFVTLDLLNPLLDDPDVMSTVQAIANAFRESSSAANITTAMPMKELDLASPRTSSTGTLNLDDINALTPQALDRAITIAASEALPQSEAVRKILTDSKLAAQISRLGVSGTIVFNDEALSDEQRKILLSILGKNTPSLRELERVMNSTIRLKSEFSPDDIKGELIIISDTKLEGYQHAKYLMFEQVAELDNSYIPVVPMIAMAKGLLNLKESTQQHLIDSIKQLSRSLSRKPLSDDIIEGYITDGIFNLELPRPETYDYNMLEELQRTALAALIAA